MAEREARAESESGSRRRSDGQISNLHDDNDDAKRPLMSTRSRSRASSAFPALLELPKLALTPGATSSVVTPNSTWNDHRCQRSNSVATTPARAVSIEHRPESAFKGGRTMHAATCRDPWAAHLGRGSIVSRVPDGPFFATARRTLGSMASLRRRSTARMDVYPEVEITVKVYHVANFDLRYQKFYADFVLMCDWIDPQLIGQDPETVNMADYFCPEVTVHNALHDFAHLSDGTSEHAVVKLFDPDLGWVKWTKRFRGTLSTGELDCRTYPFESQTLPIIFKAKKIKGAFLTLSHPILRREYDEQFANGHVVDPSSSQLTEYVILGINGSEMHRNKYGEDRNHSYEVRIIVRRKWDHVVWNILFPMFLLTLLSFVAFFIDLEDLANRFQVTLTLLLTVIAFKLCTREILPAVSYLTVLDHYIIHTIIIFWSNAWEHAVVTQLNGRLGRQVAMTVEITWLVISSVGSFLCHLWLLWNWWSASSADKSPMDMFDERDESVASTKKHDNVNYQRLLT